MFKKKDEDRKPIEQEIAELQRKFRVLENDKRACSEDSQGTIRKQRATIEKLTRENRKMKGELTETRSASGSSAENKMALENLNKLSEQVESLLQQLQNEDDVHGNLQDKVDATQRQIFSLRQDMAKKGGVNASMDNARAVQKQIRVLENRLDQGLQKFNEAVTANRGLREQIDTLRRERVVFDDIYRKLENELQQKKREMANIIEQANAAYEARDSAQAQMASLKQQADKEHAEFEKEWRELGRLIENDKRMKEFMRTKSRKDEKGPQAVTDDERHRKKLNKNAWDTAKSLATISDSQTDAMTYEEKFSRIQAATGICDIDELVQNFLNAEDQNFTLFKYNNELTADIKKLEEQIMDYKEEYITLSGNSNRKEDVEKTKLLESLEEKWNDIDKKAIHYEVKYQETQQTLSHARAIIESLFGRVGCTERELPNGCGGGIDEGNMNAYLALIESYANELMKTYQALKEDDDDDTGKPPRQIGASSNLQIKLPSTVEDYSDDEEDDDEDDQRPFTREELKTKTMRGISKRQKKSKAKGGAVDK